MEGLNRMMSSASVMTRAMGKATKIGMSQIVANRSDGDYDTRRTRIICTMGPSCWDVEKLVLMIDAGMNVCRLNFSHGDHEGHGQVVRNIIEARKRRPQQQVAILLDTKGPEIRTGFLEGGQAVEVVAGTTIRLTTDYEVKGNAKLIAISYKKLPQSVSVDNIILVADGSLSLKVVAIGDIYVDAIALNTAKIGEKKNVNLPNVRVDLPCIGEKDEHDIRDFAIPNLCHFIAVSFVQCAEDIKRLREILGNRGRHIKIISKIENVEGLHNFDGILRESDGIMIARGDLGMEIPPEKVFMAQKMMIARCNVLGKPCITATQMLESMTKSPRPTRAEAADVANAVLDGTDCVMLSGETAGGDWPVESVSVMSKVCLEAERCIDHDVAYRALLQAVPGPIETPEAVCRAAVETALSLNARMLLALTETGYTARLMAKYKPQMLILAVSASEATIMHLQVHRGVISVLIPSFQGTDNVIQHALHEAKERFLIDSGDVLVAVHGMKEEVSGSSNLLKVIEVP